MKITKSVAPAFEDYIFNWDYETYLLVGGYGSGKSYDTAFKIILKLLEEKRKALVVREVFDTIKESCYDLFVELLDDMNLLTEDPRVFRRKKNKVLALKSPLRFKFPNGSQIIFKGMDKTEKVKSINGVSIVWLEECSEIKYEGYKELLGRIRTPDVSMHFILTCNPVNRENWVYRHFFVSLDDEGQPKVIVDEKKFYELKCLVKRGVYYHHSTVDDNPWAPWQYIKRLDDLKNYDYSLYQVARFGMFGATGTRVLPQLKVANNAKQFKEAIAKLGNDAHFFGFDFGFEESFNAVLSMAVDIKRSILYIYDEIYKNHITDDLFAELPEMQKLRRKLLDLNSQGLNKMIVADNEDPKAIKYYRQNGFIIRGCRNKFKGSRLSNTRKVKRFKKIVVSPKCTNTIRELKDLTYKKAPNGDTIYDQFNIDPHSLSAIWYGLDTVTVADIKDKDFNSKKGGR